MRDKEKTAGTFSTLNKAFGPYRKRIGLLVILGFLGGITEGIGINAIIPLFSLLSGGAVQAPDFISRAILKFFYYFHVPIKLGSLLTFIILLFLFRAVAIVTFRTVRAGIRNDFTNSTMSGLLKRVLGASWPFLLKQKLGYVHNTFMRDVFQTAALLDEIGQAIMTSTALTIYFLIALNISPLITLITIGGGVLFWGFLRPLTVRIKHFGQEIISTEKQAAEHLAEHVLGIKTVKTTASEGPVLQEGVKRFQALKEVNDKANFIHFLADAAIQPLSIIFISLLLIFLTRSPSFNFAAFAAVVYIIQKIFSYLQQNQGSFNKIVLGIPYAANVISFGKILSEHQEKEGDGKPFLFQQELEFRNIFLEYESGKEVLQGIDFKISKGEIVGLIGPSGVGKTSIADLMLRLFHPQNGEITLDGVNANEIDIREWRKKVGYVAQDIFLLNDTIENNIKFYQSEISDAAMMEAAKKANIYDFIQGLELSFQTVVGERGVMLSAGQRQRVVLARVLARSPEILILDEATSALDNESERLIQKAINDLKGKITVLIIAHRLSTVMGVDNLLVLDSGKIVEQGKPQDLLQNKNSHFYRVYHARDIS